MDPQARNPQRNFIRENMQEKETEELLAIWQAHNTDEWTEEAFEVIEEILRERQSSLPERDEPLSDEGDTYHNPETLEKIATRASQVAMGFLFAAILLLMNIIITILVALFQAPPVPLARLFTTYFSSIVSSVVLILVCGFFYVALRAIEEGLFLLLDIEGNTRMKRVG